MLYLILPHVEVQGTTQNTAECPWFYLHNNYTWYTLDYNLKIIHFVHKNINAFDKMAEKLNIISIKNPY